MTSRQKQSCNLMIHFLCIIFFFVFIYMLISMFTNKSMPCGCGSGCGGANVSCPCYRNRMLMNRNMNEYYTPKINTSYTQYLDQVRQNQLDFSKEGFNNRNNINRQLSQKNIPNQLNMIKKKGGIISLM